MVDRIYLIANGTKDISFVWGEGTFHLIFQIKKSI